MNLSARFEEAAMASSDTLLSACIGPHPSPADALSPILLLQSHYLNKIITWQLASPLLSYSSLPINPCIAWGAINLYIPLLTADGVRIIFSPRSPVAHSPIPWSV